MHLLFYISVFLFTAAFAQHFIRILRLSIDLPHRDEWQIIGPALSDSVPDLTWLVTPHNEHIIATSKLLIWSLFRLNGWDIRLHLIINFLLFGALVSLAVYLALRLTPKRCRPLPLLIGIAAFSALGWENHVWAFQSQFHFFLLFSLLACVFLYSTRLKRSVSGVLAAICLLLSALSFSAGLASVFAISFCFVGGAMREPAGKRLRESARRLLIVLPALAISLPLYFSAYHRPADQPSLVLPTSPKFWSFYSNLISLGFGFEDSSLLLGAICLLVVLVSAAGAVKDGSPQAQAALAAMAGLLAALASITLGRAGHAEVEIWSKGSRYYEIAVLLLPLCAGSAFTFKHPPIRSMIVFVAAILTAIGHRNNWNYDTYSWIAEQKIAGRECLLSGEDERCSSIWGMGSAAEHRRARGIELSFWNHH